MISAHDAFSGTWFIDGIKVTYLHIPYHNHFGFLRRVYAFLRFVQLANRKVNALRTRFDLAYVMTTPLTTGLIGIHIKHKLNIPFYFEVGDLWPEAPIQMKVIRNKWVKKWLYQFEKKCYFEAHRVIALSPAIRNYIEKIVPETQVYVLTNIADTQFFKPVKVDKAYSHEHPFCIGYFGTFGEANHLDYLLNCARACLNADLPIRFLLVGEGKMYGKIKRLANKLTNVTIQPHANMLAIRKLMKAQDAIYVSFKNVRVLNTGSPNKFFDGLAAGKMIIMNFEGWIRDLVEENKCGIYHDPERPDLFVEQISTLLTNPKQIKAFQKMSRSLGERYYDKPLIIHKLIQILHNQPNFRVSDDEVYILTA